MPFLGNTPANTFVSIAKQTITGNGGTAYTLSYPVTNANEIDVFFNNVRQEPGVAYTASATTITFSEAIASTDSVYIVFNGQAVGTIDAPAGAYLPTTGGTINGSVGIKVNANSGVPLLIGRVNTDAEGGEIGLCRSTDNAAAYAIDVYGNTSTPSLRVIDNTAGAVRLNIDGSGRVTKPYQPAFDAYGTVGNFSVTTEVAIPLNSTTYNVGNHYNTSNYRFTAPVAGMYFFRAHTYKQASGNASRLRFYKNAGDVRVYQYISASDTYTHAITGIISLAVGDYVTCTFNSDGAGTNIYLADNHTNFSGYLLG